MGLDTTHGCWHGPYSMFMAWRVDLHCLLRDWSVGLDARKSLEDAWSHGDYDDQSVPINVLMNHSDCDGEIAAKDCAPLADALQALMDKKMPERATYDTIRPATQRFITGLRNAAALNEDVEFQ